MKEETVKNLKALAKATKNPTVRAALDCYYDYIDGATDCIEFEVGFHSGIVKCDDSEDLLINLVMHLAEDLSKIEEQLKLERQKAEFAKRKEM